MLPDYNFLISQWQEYLIAHKSFNARAALLEKKIIKKAIEIAIEAKSFTAQCTGITVAPENLNTILSFWGIMQSESYNQFARLFGEYIHKNKEIVLYPAVIQKYCVPFAECGFDLKSVCIAHELFHFIEAEFWGETKKIIRKCVGIHGIYSLSLRQTSEIAAHTFAQLLFNIKNIPVAFF